MNDGSARVLDELAEECSSIAISKGFWQFEVHTDSTLVKTTKAMLVVTELAELVESVRAKTPVPSSLPGFSNEEEEIADAIIRLLDYAGFYELNIGQAVVAKMEKNAGRPFQHGKNF